MKKIINEYIYSAIVNSILLGILGLILFLVPDISMSLIAYLIGAVFILNGIVFLIYGKRLDFSAILMLLAGVAIIIKPDYIKIVIPIVLGIWFIIGGVLKMRVGMFLNDSSYRLLSTILSLISILCGFIMILYPVKSLNVITVLLGSVLLINAIADIIDLLLIKRNIHLLEKELSNYLGIYIK